MTSLPGVGMQLMVGKDNWAATLNWLPHNRIYKAFPLHLRTSLFLPYQSRRIVFCFYFKHL